MPPVAPTHNARVIVILVFVVFLLALFLLWTNYSSISKLWTSQSAIAFETLDEGQHGVISERKNYALDNPGEWQDLWTVIHGKENPIPPAPEIDFTKYKILVAFQGERPSGGYSISFGKIIDTGDAIEVDVVEKEPGAGCLAAEVITEPYQVVKIPRVDKNLVSHTDREVVPCN